MSSRYLSSYEEERDTTELQNLGRRLQKCKRSVGFELFLTYRLVLLLLSRNRRWKVLVIKKHKKHTDSRFYSCCRKYLAVFYINTWIIINKLHRLTRYLAFWKKIRWLRLMLSACLSNFLNNWLQKNIFSFGHKSLAIAFDGSDVSHALTHSYD